MNKTKDAMNEQLAQAKILPLLVRLAIPAAAAQLVNALYSIVDRMYIGHMPGDGTLALSGIGLTFPITMLISAFSCLPGMGGAPLASIALGEGNQKKAQKYLCNAITLLFTISVVMMAVCLVFLKPLLVLFGADAETLPYASQYLTIYLLGTVFVEFALGLNPFINTQGHTVVGTVSVVIGAVVNIILDPILIFGLLGAPKMGVTGAAVATVIGQCVAGIVAATCNHKFNHEIKLNFKGFRPDIRIIGMVYAIGIPSIIMQSIGSVMTYCMNRILIGFSSTATAVFGVYFKLQSFFFMPVFGLNNGITPIIAYNYGAAQRKRMMKTIKLSMIVAICLTFIGFLCFEIIPQTLLGMFNASEDMLKIGVPALRIIGIHYLIAWFCIVCGTVFQALGKAIFSMFVSIMRQLVVLIPAAYLLAKFGGLHMVWWSFPIAEVISLAVSLMFLRKVYGTIIKNIPEGRE